MNQENILNRYETMLHIPHNKPRRQIAVCPVGVVGSGKTTVVKPLSKKLSLLRISLDDIRKLLKEKGYGYDSAKKIAYRLADKYIAQGFSIAIDANCNSKEAQEYIKKIRKKYNIKVFWIYVNPPEAFIIKKLRNYKHTWLFKNAEEAIKNYKSSRERLKNLNFPFIYTFDPSQKNLNEQLREATAVIKKLAKN